MQCPADIIAALVSFDNPYGTITNSDLELVALVLHVATFPLMCSVSLWRASSTGSNNTPTVAWSFKEASGINPVVEALLRVHTVANSASLLSPSVFYHLGDLDTMADDASCSFKSSSSAFIASCSSKYSPLQSPGS